MSGQTFFQNPQKQGKSHHISEKYLKLSWTECLLFDICWTVHLKLDCFWTYSRQTFFIRQAFLQLYYKYISLASNQNVLPGRSYKHFMQPNINLTMKYLFLSFLRIIMTLFLKIFLLRQCCVINHILSYKHWNTGDKPLGVYVHTKFQAEHKLSKSSLQLNRQMS